MKSIIDYFIIGHNTEVLSDSMNWPLPNTNLLLVGNSHNQEKNCIVSKFLDNNIEDSYNLCSYTGWHSIAKNRLGDHNYICLLEYDIKLNNNFHKYTHTTITNTSHKNFVIAYSSTTFDHYVFYKSTPWLEIFLSHIYQIDIMQFVEDHRHKYKIWPTTTNLTLPRHILNNFIDWFSPFVCLSRNHPLSAYVHERAFFIYCILHNIDIIYLPNILQHKQLQSHKINDIYGQFMTNKKADFFSNDMIEEYDAVYLDQYNRCMAYLKEPLLT